MSLLVDYASSSEDEASPSASVPATTHTSVPSPSLYLISHKNASSKALSATSNASFKPKQKRMKQKKTKTTLYLPPEIQRLLEMGTNGGALSDDSEDDNELLAKHKRAKKAANKRPRPVTTKEDSVLSFLPPPKHELPVAEVPTIKSEEQEEKKRQEVAEETHTEQQEAANAAAWQQYYQQQQQYQTTGSYATASEDLYVAQGEDDVPGGSSKRRRTRERDIERALQQGHFETVAGQIAEVQGPAPNAWQPPINPLTRETGSTEQDVKVKASFWNAQAGTKISSVKPSRLQRQKHQLNQLAFDAKLRDFELLDQRSTSLKTKRETYAKYGW